MRVALKTVQQDERGIYWTSPLNVVELQTTDGDTFILSKGGQAHSALLSRSHHVSTRVYMCTLSLLPYSDQRYVSRRTQARHDTASHAGQASGHPTVYMQVAKGYTTVLWQDEWS